MLIDFSLDSFDKAFWVSSTNMRHIIDAAIAININLGNVEQQVDYIQNDINNMQNQINDNFSDLKGDVSDIWNALADDKRDIMNLAQLILSLQERVEALEGK